MYFITYVSASYSVCEVVLAIENMDGKEDLHRNLGDHEAYDSEEDEYEADVPSNYLPSEKIEEKTYTTLTEEDISQRQEEEVENDCSILSISKDEAVIISLHFKWNAAWVTDGCFVKKANIRRDLGLLETEVAEVNPNSLMICGVCRYRYCISGMSAGNCGN